MVSNERTRSQVNVECGGDIGRQTGAEHSAAEEHRHQQSSNAGTRRGEGGADDTQVVGGQQTGNGGVGGGFGLGRWLKMSCGASIDRTRKARKVLNGGGLGTTCQETLTHYAKCAVSPKKS